MLDDLIRKLKRMERDPLRIPIETDADGYFDRECPNTECEFQFKVILQEWKNDFNDKQMYCPLCGKFEQAEHFWTKEHHERAKQQAERYISGLIGQALAEEACDFNAKQSRGGLISISLDYNGPKRVPALIPIEAADEMLIKITCDHCATHFAVLGSAFFCPKCGYSSAVQVFNDAMAKIEAKTQHLDRVIEAVAQVDKDAAELTRRSLIESGICDAVVAFQRVMEELYRTHSRASEKIKTNVFQRLDDGSNLWEATGCPAYADVLSEKELERMHVLFQRRHLLAHREGIVDKQYIDRSNDTSYAPGQRISVRPEHVDELVILVRKLVGKYMPSKETS
jgi:uncharacterized Zn finger protein (UPF0148 family)